MRDPLSLLPWGPGFRMLDRMLACFEHERIVTLKRVTANDAIHEGAPEGSQAGFYPAVLVLEGMGQSAALLFRLSYGPGSLSGAPMLGHLRASFGGAGARPGDTIEYSVRALKMTSRGGLFAAVARVGETTLAEAELGFGVGAR